MLTALFQTYWLDPSQPPPIEAHITDIRYISLLVPIWKIYPPQYWDIHFMSSGSSHLVQDIPSASSPLEDNNTYPLTVQPVTSQDPLYSHIFHFDKDILEELTTLDFPWNVIHHWALFFSQEAFHPPTQSSMCAIETKDFIPLGNIYYFNNPIPTPNDF